jgi:hypothetical protein
VLDNVTAAVAIVTFLLEILHIEDPIFSPFAFFIDWKLVLKTVLAALLITVPSASDLISQ